MKHPQRGAALRALPARRGSRGSSLIFALLALAALSLSALALIRSIDTGTLVLGNMGFKQETAAVADRATELAIKHLGELQSKADGDAKGYYAHYRDELDATGGQRTTNTRILIDWDDNDCATFGEGKCDLEPEPVDDPDNQLIGNKAKFVILRLCKLDGAPDDPDQICIKPMEVTVTGGAAGGIDYGALPGSVQGVTPYYRIIVRVVGARNTTTYTETIVRF